MIGNVDHLAPLRTWFSKWGTYVRARDFVGARDLFRPDVSGFGTHVAIVFGQAALEREQWSNVWPMIEDFTFDVAHLHGAIADDQAWAAVRWTSTGFHEDGRCTG